MSQRVAQRAVAPKGVVVQVGWREVVVQVAQRAVVVQVRRRGVVVQVRESTDKEEQEDEEGAKEGTEEHSCE